MQECSLRGEREQGWAGGILKSAAGRRVSGTPWSGQSCRSNPISACLEEWSGEGVGRCGPSCCPFPASVPAPTSCRGHRDPGDLSRGGTLSSPFHSGMCPLGGGTATAVARLRALGFINNAARRWGPAQPPVTLGHSGWRIQLAVLWQSPSSLQPAWLLCSGCVSLGSRPSLSEPH